LNETRASVGGAKADFFHRKKTPLPRKRSILERPPDYLQKKEWKRLIIVPAIARELAKEKSSLRGPLPAGLSWVMEILVWLVG